MIEGSQAPLSLPFILGFCFSFLCICWHPGAGHRAQYLRPTSLSSSCPGNSPMISSTCYLQYSLGPLPSLPHFHLRLPAEAKDKYKQSELWTRLTGSRVPISLAQPERVPIPLTWPHAPDISLYNLSKGLRSLLYSAKTLPNRKTKISGTSGTTCHQAFAIRVNILS